LPRIRSLSRVSAAGSWPLRQRIFLTFCYHPGASLDLLEFGEYAWINPELGFFLVGFLINPLIPLKIIIIGPSSPLMLDLKKERKSNKNLIFLHIKHSMVVKNDALMNSNHTPIPSFCSSPSKMNKEKEILTKLLDHFRR